MTPEHLGSLRPASWRFFGTVLGALCLASCATVPTLAACSPGSIAAVVDVIKSGRDTSPDTVAAAGRCWLDRYEESGRDDAEAEVKALRDALSVGGDVADALVACDAKAPGVCR